MRKIGLLVGRERSFPDALIQEVNRREAGVVAEFVQLGGSRMAEPCPYHVIIDRISHEVPYYQLYLKNAVLSGTTVINNPFWRVADDKFFGTSLADKLGIAVPKTVVLPNKDYVEGIVSESLRNLIYPLDWEGIVRYVGLPAILKPHWGGGWREVTRVESLLDLIWRYDQSGRQTMILQEFIEWGQYVRCLCIGQTNILPVVWDPTQPHFQRYRADAPPLDPVLSARVTADATKICQALGYDMNTVEFAICDGVPYAIDFMNSAPDFDISSLTPQPFEWVVNAMADLVITRATAESGELPRAWSEFMSW